MQTEPHQESMFVECEWWPSERVVLLPPEWISTAEHAEKYRYVMKSERPGPWRNRNNPPLVGIMNAADRAGTFRNTRTLVILKGVQTGATEAAHNIIYKRMDGSAQNALVTMESERKMRRTFKQRIIESIRRHGRLSGQMSENPDDTTNYSITMRTGFNLNTGWAGSQAAMASDPCELVVIDEADKGDAPINVEEAKDRITTFRETGLCVILSTPGMEGGPIAVEFDLCDAQLDYHAECPDCSTRQPMDFEHFHWPEKGEAKRPGEWKRLAGRVAREKSARYICAGCGSLWDDYMRDQAVLGGLGHNFHGWKMREEVAFPVAAGFKLPSWISPFKSLSDVAARWIRAQEPNQPGKLRAWHNNEAAEPFAEAHSERKEDAVLSLRDDRPRGLVPSDASCLLLLADTQQRGFYFEVAAIGWGPSLTSWQVREGYVETFDGLKEVLAGDYRDAGGNIHKIAAGAIDSGGGTGTVPKHSRTAEVYRFCRENPIMRPLKGRQTMTQPVTPTKIDFYPGTKNPIPGGLQLFMVNVTYFKDQLASKLAVNPDDPGAWRLHAECTDEYARQMTAEYRDERGRWQCPKGRANHYWDLGVYRLALAEMLQIKFWKRPEEGAKPQGRRIVSKGSEI